MPSAVAHVAGASFDLQLLGGGGWGGGEWCHLLPETSLENMSAYSGADLKVKGFN